MFDCLLDPVKAVAARPSYASLTGNESELPRVYARAVGVVPDLCLRHPRRLTKAQKARDRLDALHCALEEPLIAR
jgi:hypothetical protein